MINILLLFINLSLISIVRNKLKIKWGLVLYIYPILVFIASNFFDFDFLSLGDGISYYREYKKYYLNDSLAIQIDGLNGLLDYLKVVNLGIAPLYYIINGIIDSQESEVYFSLQGTYYLSLMYIAILLTYTGKNQYSQVFKIVSTSCIFLPFIFELLSAPTRHVVTLVAGFLIYFSYKNIIANLNFYNMFVLSIALSLLLISKAVLIPLFIIFVVFDLYFYQKASKNNILIILLLAFLLPIFLNFELLTNYLTKYINISETGASTFSSLTNIWIIGWVIKYIYAILSPFPWITDAYALDLIYGGNIILYINHIFSSLLVLYVFICVIFEFKYIYIKNKEVSNSILYGLIMSSSVLFGATGFNIYLIIWVPFLFPVVLYLRHGYFYLIFTVSFPIMCEILIFIFK